MLVFFAFAALALFWVCFIALAKFERGWVGVTDLQRAMLRMVGGFRLMTIALGEALLPIVRKTTKQLVAFNEAMERDRG